MAVERVVIGEKRGRLSREQKVGLSFVIICGLGALVLGSLYVWRHVAVPFVITYEGPRTSLNKDEDALTSEAKRSDTDEDGLSDYDEQKIYNTSAYIADTDSDGLSDGVEVTSGQDPLCALGKTCDNILENPDAVRAETANGTFLSGVAEPVTPDGVATEADIAALEALTPEQIRSLLLEAGVSEVELNKLTDEEITALYQQVLSQVSAEQVGN